jgi:hypothetical protein
MLGAVGRAACRGAYPCGQAVKRAARPASVGERLPHDRRSGFVNFGDTVNLIRVRRLVPQRQIVVEELFEREREVGRHHAAALRTHVAQPLIPPPI